MDTCAVEVGLLKKHPCGQNAVAKCANCEMALCTKHAVRTRTGKFMCAECARADRTVDTTPTPAPKPAAPAAAKPAATPAQAAAPKPAAPAPKPAAPAAAQPAAKAAEKPKEPAKEEKFKLEDTGPIEFTPTKKP